MNETAEGKKFTFEFTGDIVDCVIAPVPRDKAEQWLTRDPRALFDQAFGLDKNSGENYAGLQDAAYLGRAGELAGAQFLEGCELRHGSLEIRDSHGNAVGSFSLDDAKFEDDFIDRVDRIDPETHLLNNGPTLITRTLYSGAVVYKSDKPVDLFEEGGLYVIVTDMGGEPFISTVNFNNEDLPPGGTGPYASQEVWLLVPDESGNIRRVLFAAETPAAEAGS